MCGIIGYTGTSDAIPKMTEGLSVLEYRGYDSVGIAAETEGEISVVKCRGRITHLKEKLEAEGTPVSGTAIGHTRWATHGAPSDENAHPHRVGNVVLVHNGIIENHRELKQALLGRGTVFHSETDTEVAAAVLHEVYSREGEPIRAIRAATEELEGSYAFGILFADRPGEIYAARFGSPLILAKGRDGYYLASDLTAILPFTNEYYPLEEGEICCLTPEAAFLYGADGTGVVPRWERATMTAEAAQKGGYEHFMLKEIHEQPEALRKSVATRVRGEEADFSADGIAAEFWREVKSIQIVACGSAMHAGLVGARMLEEYAGVPTTVHIASEYRYHPPLSSEGTLVVIISQSGETADSLAALRHAKARGIPTLALVNAVGTTIAREADHCIYTYAGPEIAVATTKGYCTQVSVLWLMAAAIGAANGALSAEEAAAIVKGLMSEAPVAIETALSSYSDAIDRIAERLVSASHIFYIGRGRDYALSMEAALKLKEISYIHAEAYAAGELKHGTISLVEEGTPVIAISTERALYPKTESNVREVASRGAYVILLCREDAEHPELAADTVLRLPVSSEAATFFATLAMIQMIAYRTAGLRGCDIDRPRNLAKSVTVE